MRDLGLQDLGSLLHDRDRRMHLGKMLRQHLAPLGGSRVPFAAQAREDLHLPDGHVGLAQTQQESDPFQVRGRITALAARCTCHRRDQPGTLVIAQGMRRQAGALCHFGNGQEGCHGNDSRSLSVL